MLGSFFFVAFACIVCCLSIKCVWKWKHIIWFGWLLKMWVQARSKGLQQQQKYGEKLHIRMNSHWHRRQHGARRQKETKSINEFTRFKENRFMVYSHSLKNRFECNGVRPNLNTRNPWKWALSLARSRERNLFRKYRIDKRTIETKHTDIQWLACIRVAQHWSHCKEH